jgi:inorganic pyrophosphatase
MNFIEQLEEEPLSELIRYKSGAPKNAVAFSGTLRKHPYDADKCLLLADPSSADRVSSKQPGFAPAGFAPAILEFRKADVLGVEELASPVDESGHSRQVLRLWIKRGSLGVRYEPFEVDEPLRFPGGTNVHDRVLSGFRP